MTGALERLLSGLGLREGERRPALVAFAALFFTMLGHAALETARDALFLESLPPEDLPLVYLGVAAVALVVGRAALAAKRRFGARAVPVTLWGGAVITALLWRGVQTGQASLLAALYVWVGVFAMAATTQLWLHISEVLHVGQAKRIYGFVGAGGLLGAFVGAAGAAGALMVTQTANLLPLAAFAFVLAGLVAGLAVEPTTAEPPRRGEPSDRAPTKSSDRERRYARRLALSVFVATALFTSVDLVFKTAVAQNVAPEALGPYFAKVYAALDLAALIVQLWLAPKLLRTIGVHRSAAILPLLLLASGLGLLAFGGLAAALLGKGADGVLRHGLHKTSAEILYMPLSNAARARLKTVTEVLAQRGGQAVAAGLSLGAALLGIELEAAGPIVAGLAGLWLFVLYGLQRDYLGLFRRHLRRGVGDAQVPELDLGALEVLIVSLSAEDDQEVIGALDWLEAYDKAHLVPPLILLHPSQQVALRAFSFFDEHPSPEALKVARRRCKDEDPEIRAATIHFVARHGDDERALEAALEDDSPVVRAEGLTILLAKGRIGAEAASEALEDIADSPGGALVVARAFGSLPPSAFEGLACRLTASDDADVLVELAHALGDNDADAYVEPLIRLLGRRPSHAAARRALVARGAAALDPITRALARKDLPWTVRRRLADTLVEVDVEAGAARLIGWLEADHPDREVRAAVRALGRLVSRHPEARLDGAALLDLARYWLERAITFLHARVAVRCMLSRSPAARTPTSQLLTTVLEEKEQFALEQVFLLLHTRNPQAGFRSMHETLTTKDARAHASTRELLAHLVPPDLRKGIDALTDDVRDRDRLEAAVEVYEPPTRARLRAIEPALDGELAEVSEAAVRRAYSELLDALSREPSEVLGRLVGFHRAELEGAGEAPPDASVDLAVRAVSSLEAPTEDLTHAWR